MHLRLICSLISVFSVILFTGSLGLDSGFGDINIIVAFNKIKHKYIYVFYI